MKKILFSTALLCFSIFSVKSQDTTQASVYAGLVGSGFIQVDSGGALVKQANLRVGLDVKRKISPKLSFIGWLGYDPGDGLVIFRASLEKSFKGGGISMGYQPTPVSQIRPHPFTVDGQFQFAAESMPPSGTLGGSIWYKGFKVGLYVRNTKPEYQFSYTKKVWTVGAWTGGGQFGGVTGKIELPRLYSMVTITDDNKQAIALGFKPLKKNPYKIVCDFSVKKKKITNCLIGIQHSVETKKFEALRYGIGYDAVRKQAGVFFLVSVKKHT